jgi:eukaryotic-like serine/threonine-protein kinase
MEREGRYLVFDEIAAGGMGAVHLGRLRGPAGFGRLVAIKRLHAHLAKEPEFVAMLLDEARIASRIHHPNVVQIIDVLAENRLTLVLEYVHGPALVAVARQRPIEPGIAVAIAIGMLSGLHAAHETCGEDGRSLGIVHRDVSPQNVLVGVDGTARILDFGVAKAAGRIQTTHDGQLKGKLAYMAPEQLHAEEEVDRRADIWAASVVLWEMLTGRRLFGEANDASIIGRVLEAPIEPPGRVVPHPWPALDAAVCRGLARDPAARFATAKEMARALEAALPAASASRVGEWVVREWDEERVRRQTISAVEQDVVPTVASADDRTETGLQVPLPAAAARSRSRGRALRWTLGLTAATAAALALGGWRYAATHRSEASARSVSAAPVPVAPDIPPAIDTAVVMAQRPAPSAPSRTRAAPQRRSVGSRDVQPPPPRPDPTASAPPPACDPPYTRDAKGNTTWKRECFR